MSLTDGFSELWEHLADLALHDPETCTTPGHIVIETKGQFYCGPGGYWPNSGEGLVYLRKGTQLGEAVRGKFVRENR